MFAYTDLYSRTGGGTWQELHPLGQGVPSQGFLMCLSELLNMLPGYPALWGGRRRGEGSGESEKEIKQKYKLLVKLVKSVRNVK